MGFVKKMMSQDYDRRLFHLLLGFQQIWQLYMLQIHITFCNYRLKKILITNKVTVSMFWRWRNASFFCWSWHPVGIKVQCGAQTLLCLVVICCVYFAEPSMYHTVVSSCKTNHYKHYPTKYNFLITVSKWIRQKTTEISKIAKSWMKDVGIISGN